MTKIGSFAPNIEKRTKSTALLTNGGGPVVQITRETLCLKQHPLGNREVAPNTSQTQGLCNKTPIDISPSIPNVETMCNATIANANPISLKKESNLRLLK